MFEKQLCDRLQNLHKFVTNDFSFRKFVRNQSFSFRSIVAVFCFLVSRIMSRLPRGPPSHRQTTAAASPPPPEASGGSSGSDSDEDESSNFGGLTPSECSFVNGLIEKLMTAPLTFRNTSTKGWVSFWKRWDVRNWYARTAAFRCWSALMKAKLFLGSVKVAPNPDPWHLKSMFIWLHPKFYKFVVWHLIHFWSKKVWSKFPSEFFMASWIWFRCLLPRTSISSIFGIWLFQRCFATLDSGRHSRPISRFENDVVCHRIPHRTRVRLPRGLRRSRLPGCGRVVFVAVFESQIPSQGFHVGKWTSPNTCLQD